jgi:hypothetical protein
LPRTPSMSLTAFICFAPDALIALTDEGCFPMRSRHMLNSSVGADGRHGAQWRCPARSAGRSLQVKVCSGSMPAGIGRQPDVGKARRFSPNHIEKVRRPCEKADLVHFCNDLRGCFSCGSGPL